MVDTSKPANASSSSGQQDSSTRVKFASIFETIDVSKRRTKIIATLGDSSKDEDQIVKMIDAGMNVARVDFTADVDHETGSAQVACLQAATTKRPDKQIALMLETRGFCIMTNACQDNEDVQVKAGQVIEIDSDFDKEGSTESGRVGCDFKELPSAVQVGSALVIGTDTNMTMFTVTEVCEVSFNKRMASVKDWARCL